MLKNENVLFPKIIASDENFIVEKWINGQSFSKLKKNLIEKDRKSNKFLKKIHFEPDFLDLSKNL